MAEEKLEKNTQSIDESLDSPKKKKKIRSGDQSLDNPKKEKEDSIGRRISG